MTLVEPAAVTDAGAIYALRRRLVDWLAARDIQQWNHDDLHRDEVIRQVQHGEWHVVHGSDISVVAAMRLLWQDPEIWGEDGARAIYLHGLMVDRRLAGQGLGDTLLAWAGQLARIGGADVLRLDCSESNPALRAYYRRHGFCEVGRRDFDHGWFSVTLFEKPL